MGRLCGRFDPPLSEAGRRQSEALAAALGETAVIRSSPALRALETACALGPEPIVDQGLRELDFGEADGLSFDEVAVRWPELYEAWLRAPTEVRFPGGEAFVDFRSRVLDVVRTVLAHWLGMPDEAIVRIDVGIATVSVVEWLDGTPVVRLLNAAPASLAPDG